jgi:hypothetical protein
MSILKVMMIISLFVISLGSGQFDTYYSIKQPGPISASQISQFTRADEGLTPASGYNMPRNVQISQSSSDEFLVSIPNSEDGSGQVRSDGTSSSYTNVGSSAGVNSQVFLSFDISSIPKDAQITDATLQFRGLDIVGDPFSNLGCLSVLVATSSLPVYQSHSNTVYSNMVNPIPCLKICSSGQLNSPLNSSDLLRALQASLGQGKFQLRLQFNGGAGGTVSGRSATSTGYIGKNYPTTVSVRNAEDYLSTGDTSGGYTGDSGFSVSKDYDQAIQDMGIDRSFSLSDTSMKSQGYNSNYIILAPGVNLSKLGVTQDMIEKAIGSGRVRVEANYMYEQASVKDVVNNSVEPIRSMEAGFNGSNQKASDSGGGNCPAGYCLDSNGDGYCDSSGVVGVSHIGWLSREPVSDIKGRHAEYGRSVEDLTGVFSINEFLDLGKCCPDSDGDGKCDNGKPKGPLCPTGQIENPASPGTCCDDSDNNGFCDTLYAVSECNPGQILQNGVCCNDFDNNGVCDTLYAVSECNPGQILQNGACCNDLNSNGICDYSEANLLKIGAIWLDIKYNMLQDRSNKGEDQTNKRVDQTNGYNGYQPLPIMGAGNFTEPEPSLLIDASPAGWGQVPPNQVLVEVNISLSFEEARAIANTLAGVLGGQVVGELEYINLFQIETPSRSLNELIRDVNGARKYPSVILAFPNLQVYRESSPLQNRVYQGENGKSFEIIGVQKSWDDIDSCHINLSKVHVGVTDDGIYKGYGEFNKLDVNTSIKIYDSAPPSQLARPVRGYETIGSHGTGVMNILAADPDNGGLVGIASAPLRDHLKCDMINIFDQNRSFITSTLLGLKHEIEDGCTIFSISWGNSSADEQAVRMYENWFKKLSKDYPQLLFICSAGNEGEPIDGSRRIPNGFGLGNVSSPNIITVGNINNTGERCERSNMNLYRDYVTLAAPGEQVVWGLNNSGDMINFSGGTSMATPQVAAAAALIRSLNPSLNASQIKTILVETAYHNVGDVEAPSDLGGGILAVDKAVEKAVEERSIGSGASAPSNVTGPIEIPTDANRGIQGNRDTNIDIQGNRDTNTLGNQTGNLGTVRGKLSERNTGTGIASAELSYRKMPGGDETMTGIMTDGNGNYQLKLPAGQYQIGAKASGYGVIPWVVTVNSGQTSEMNLKAVKGVLA